MITIDYCKAMAEYNAVMNKQLYYVCDSLSNSDRMRDVGLFFGSIHRTLDHILYGDMAWILRFQGKENDIPDLDQQLHDEFLKLSQARKQWDQKIINWSSSISNDWLSSDLTYSSKSDGKTRSRKAWLLTTHLFNHETHHRGQVTAALSQMGYDFGVTDLPVFIK